MPRNILSQIIPNSLKTLVKKRVGVPDMFHSIENLKKLGFQPKNIIDIGAYQGEWTERVLKIFPTSSFHMIEAMPEKELYLKSVKERHKNTSYSIALLAAKPEQEISFNQLETASSVLSEHLPTNAHTIQLKTSTLDQLAKVNSFEDVDLIKLDTQGYELEILKGGKKCLQEAGVILMEVSLIDIHQNVPLLHDVVIFMQKHDFVAFDICSLTRRPLDQALWQTDIIFVKTDSFLRTNKKWSH